MEPKDLFTFFKIAYNNIKFQALLENEKEEK